MPSLNKVVLIGHIGQDPTSPKDGMVTFSLATNDDYKDKSGTWIKKTDWHKVVVFNQHTANYILGNAKKGTLVYVEGKLTQNKYTATTGEEKISTEIHVSPYKGEVMLISNHEKEQDKITPLGQMPTYEKMHGMLPPKKPGSVKDMLDQNAPFDDGIPF